MIKDHVSRNVTKSNYRVILVRATQTAQQIGEGQHQLSGVALSHFCDGILAALLLATQLKGQGVVSVEFDSDGAFDSYRCDATPLGLVRAMIPDTTLEKIQKQTSEQPLIGKGNLYISKKIETANQPFHSVLELVSDNFSKNISHYLHKSEQINALVSLCTIVDGSRVVSCDGFMIEEMPDTKKEGQEQMYIQTTKISDPIQFFKDAPSDQTVLKKILGEIEYVHLKELEVEFFCPCSRERFFNGLIGLPRNEIESLGSQSEEIETSCDFCKKSYKFSIKEILNKKDSNN